MLLSMDIQAGALPEPRGIVGYFPSTAVPNLQGYSLAFHRHLYASRFVQDAGRAEFSRSFWFPIYIQLLLDAVPVSGRSPCLWSQVFVIGSTAEFWKNVGTGPTHREFLNTPADVCPKILTRACSWIGSHPQLAHNA